MPIGGGIIPGSSTGQYSELTYLTRRAFVPKMFVQIYQSSPLLAAALSGAETAGGGVSSITIIPQGQSMVDGQWMGYDGNFSAPQSKQGVTGNAEFNLKMLGVPIPFVGMEGLVQQDHAIVSLIDARMNDATSVMKDLMATAMYSNTTNTQAWTGLAAAVDDSTNASTYGGISRSTYTWWKSKVYNAGGATPTRQLILQYINGCVKASGGEKPNFAVCGFGTWTALAQDYVGQEQYTLQPGQGFTTDTEGPKSAFQAMMVAGVPIYADAYCPEGTMYFLNTDYINLHVHPNASFAFTDFHSTLANWQVGFVGVVLTAAELVNAKPKSCVRVDNLGYVTV